MKSKYEECVQEWEPNFRIKSALYRNGMERRKYQDIFCIPIFVLLIFTLTSFSAYLIHFGYKLWKSTDFEISFLYNFEPLTSKSTQVMIMIGSLIVLNIIGMLFAIKMLGKYPQISIKIIVIMSVLTLAGLSIYSFITKEIALGAILLILFILYVLAMFCIFHDHMKTSVALCKIVGCFMEQKPSVFLISLAVSFFACIVAGILIMSAAALLQMIAFGEITDTFGEIYLLTQIIQYILILYFIYYATVFLVSCSVSSWYSENSSYSICTGIGWMLYNHLGSITFVALAITPIKILSTITDAAQKNTDNMCAQISICLLKPCLSLFEGLSKTLNRYSVMTIAFTGQSFVSGSRTAAVISFSNLKMLKQVRGIQTFLFLSLWSLTVVWSAALGVIFGDFLKIQQGIIFTSVILIGINAITSLIITSIFTQSLSCGFFFFLMHQKIKGYGHKIFNIDKSVKGWFKQMYMENECGNIQDSDDEIVVCKSQKEQLTKGHISEMQEFQTQYKLNFYRNK